MREDNLRSTENLIAFAVLAVFLGGSVGLWFALGPFALALLLPVALFVLLAAQRKLLRRLERNERRLRNDVVRQVQALHAIHTLLPIRSPLPPMGQYTIDPDFAALLASTVLEHRPRRVLELGSGVSTLIVAYALRAAGGGQLVSVDESERYRDSTLAHIRRHGLEDVAHVIHAPLVERQVGDSPYRWYDTTRFGDIPAIDLMIVDGPSGRTGPLARFPALPLLWHKLGPASVILMDDADRDDERHIITKWCEQYPSLRREHIRTRKGACVLVRGDD